MYREYQTITEVAGPLVIVDKVGNKAFEEVVKIITSSGEEKLGQVLETGDDKAVIQVFGPTTGVDIDNTKVRFLGETMKFGLSPSILGRTFNGSGKPIDGGPEITPEVTKDINGEAMNPSERDKPLDFIQTGVSPIDMMNTLVRGQKLPIFSGAGLPHNELAAQIARQATVMGKGEDFAVVFAAMGITKEEAMFFQDEFEKTGTFEKAVVFLNQAGDPVIERILTPRLALTTAEYLAYEKNMHVLVILTDLTNYCEALREVAGARKEIPGRRGYPGYMYTDLANLYERAGRVKGKKGSITQIPILTMPDDDITHPIPDLTGYITEGQIVLDRNLHTAGIYPPIDVLTSLSRLMNNGIGEGKTRDDHSDVSNQLYAAYAQGKSLRDLVKVIGEESLEDLDRLYLKFADFFEKEFIQQDMTENRPIETTINKAWSLLGRLPKTELKRIKPKFIDKHYKEQKTE